MRKTLSLTIFMMMVILALEGFSQSKQKLPKLPAYPYPPTKMYDTLMTWCGVSIQYILDRTQVVFEGKVLSDSIFISNGHTYTYHLVEVLKLFKGEFSSDTVAIATGGGGGDFMNGLALDDVQFGQKGDIAFFLVRDFDNMYHCLNPEGCGYITLCDKKDVEKYIYAPMEKAIGHSYKEIHPSDCPNTKAENDKK